MPQTFRVLQCYSCSAFQVHPLKKTNKWTCKICNEKQSVMKVYDQGSSVDCRRLVQKMNLLQKDKDHFQDVNVMSPHPPEDYAAGYSNESGEDSPALNTNSRPATILSSRQGRWAIFSEPKESDSDQELEENEKGDTFTTSREEFEQICRKVRKERSTVRSAHSRLTGFHPVSKGRNNEGSLLKAHSTTSLPASLSTDDDDALFPYSSIGEHIGEMLNNHAVKIVSTKSLHNLDDVYGSYQKIEESSDFVSESKSSKRSLTDGHIVSSAIKDNHTNSSAIKEDMPRTSKWAKFLTSADADYN